MRFPEEIVSWVLVREEKGGTGHLDSTHNRRQWSLVMKSLDSGSERSRLSVWYFILCALDKLLNFLTPSFLHLKNTDNGKYLKGLWWGWNEVTHVSTICWVLSMCWYSTQNWMWFIYRICGTSSGTCWVVDKYYFLYYLFTHFTNICWASAECQPVF